MSPRKLSRHSSESCFQKNMQWLCSLMYTYKVKVRVLVAQSCPTLCHPMDCSPPGSSVHGILQARILEWVAISFSRASSWPRVQTRVSHTAGRFFTFWATREAPVRIVHMYKYAWALYTWASFCVPMWPFVSWGKWHRYLCGYAHVHFFKLCFCMSMGVYVSCVWCFGVGWLWVAMNVGWQSHNGKEAW